LPILNALYVEHAQSLREQDNDASMYKKYQELGKEEKFNSENFFNETIFATFSAAIPSQIYFSEIIWAK